MNLSKNITLEQFTRSDYATRNGIEEQFNPEPHLIENAQALCENVIEKLLLLFPDLHISSGYRCTRVNQGIGGSITSQHCKMEAADLVINGKSNIEIAKAVLSAKIPFDQMIVEFGTMEKPSWIHVSFSKEKNRGQILRAEIINGSTQYRALTKKDIL